MCVGDISALLEMTISAVSHQLKILRDSNLVKTRRNGKVVYYSPADEHVQKVIECGVEHIMEKFEEKYPQHISWLKNFIPKHKLPFIFWQQFREYLHTQNIYFKDEKKEDSNNG